jgi:microsomal dipeptidase-like Zn-dependent dipeptidase
MTSKCKVSLVFIAALFLTTCGTEDADTASSEEEFVSSDTVAEATEQLRARARAIHERVITLDTHADIDTGDFTTSTNYTMNLDTQVNLPKMDAGGLDVAWFIVYTGQSTLDNAGYAAAYANAIDKFEAIHRLAEVIAPNQIEIAYSSDDVRSIIAAGKKVAMIGIENAYPVGLDMSNIADFHARGGRYMSLAHNGHSQFADSNTGERDSDFLHNGLSELGREAIAEMNRLGIMIDISHPSKPAIMEMLDLTRAPLIASHSSARAVSEHSRNLDDEQLLRVKENGGVVQTVAFAGYLDADKYAAYQAARSTLQQSIAADIGFELLSFPERGDLSEADAAEYNRNMVQLNARTESRMEAEVNSIAPPVDVADFVDHVDYLVDLIGLEHVGISSDFDGGGGVSGWNDASETFNVTLELVSRGYSEKEIGLLWSGNLLRVLDDVQRIAAEIQAE